MNSESKHDGSKVKLALTADAAKNLCWHSIIINFKCFFAITHTCINFTFIAAIQTNLLIFIAKSPHSKSVNKIPT